MGDEHRQLIDLGIGQAERNEFVGQLMQKAGLPPSYWSPSIRCSRYRCLVIEEA